MQYEVLTKDVAAQTFTSVKRRVPIAELSSYIEQAIAEVRRILNEAGMPETGAPFAIFHEKVNEASAGEVEVCVPCSGSDLDEGVVERRSLPAMTVAYANVPAERAHYPDIVEAYDAITNHLHDDGRQPGGPPRETYGEGSTEVSWPLKTSGATASAR